MADTELKFILLMLLHKMCGDNLSSESMNVLEKLENKYKEEISND